jgi:hypothetical protein
VDSDVYAAYADGTFDPWATQVSAFSFYDDAVTRPLG